MADNCTLVNVCTVSVNQLEVYVHMYCLKEKYDQRGTSQKFLIQGSRFLAIYIAYIADLSQTLNLSIFENFTPVTR